MKHRSSELDMLHGPPAGKLLRFTLPIALSSIVQQLFNAADTAVVGSFGSADALAAVGTNTEIIALIVTYPWTRGYQRRTSSSNAPLVSALDPAHQFQIPVLHRLTAFSVSITQKHPQKDEPRRTFFMTAKKPGSLAYKTSGQFRFYSHSLQGLIT